jgi:beta-barrel assembly-enhancing protease
MRKILALTVAGVVILAAPAAAAGKRALPKKAALSEEVQSAVSEAASIPLKGCPEPTAGSLPAARKVDRSRGRFSIDQSPFISTLTASDICANNLKMRSGVGASAGVLGLSSQVMNTRSARMDLMALPAVELEMRGILERFAKAWPYAPLERTPKILFRASDAYEAQALPDNTIIISMGLIEAADSDSEVLFAVAHEYSHLLLGHFTKAGTLEGTKGAIKAVSQVYEAGSFVSSMRGSGPTGALSGAQAGIDRAHKKATVLSEALRFAVDDIFAPAWNRDQENEADALAIDLLIRSNMTIDSYANVFARLQKAFATEKASRDKRAELAESVQKSFTESVKSLAAANTLAGAGGMKGLGTGLFKSLGGALLNNFGSITKAIGGDSHLPPEDRRNGLAAYFQAGYPDADPPIDTGALLKRIKSRPEFQRATALKTSYLKARQTYFSQNFAGASQALRGIGAGSKTAPTFVNYVAGLSARDAGNYSAAASYFDAGRTGSGVQNLQLYETYTEMELNTHDTIRASSVIADGKSKFKDPDHFKSMEIRRDLASGDTAGAQTTYDNCLQVKGRDYITERCKAAMPDTKGGIFGIKLPFGG